MTSFEAPVVAVDGPNAAGKGTLCQLLAGHFGFHLLDSGALYRLVALAASQAGASFEDIEELVGHARDLAVSFSVQPGGVKVLLDGADVTQRIRTETVGNLASKVAALDPVRSALLDRQRAFRQPPGLVADGRDMGTVVFPDATVKIFLTASAEVRARRRHNQLRDQGIDVNLATLSAEIEERDRRDRERAVAPLRPADDAITVDSSHVSIEAVFAQVRETVRKRMSP
ncbi:MAG: (d)CMP kinase [Gammaproteobacteria bacterium]|nr:(d)CMP kinase [Gammaproteobacteria bacterium]